jgi:hypothetical protein
MNPSPSSGRPILSPHAMGLREENSESVSSPSALGDEASLAGENGGLPGDHSEAIPWPK